MTNHNIGVDINDTQPGWAINRYPAVLGGQVKKHPAQDFVFTFRLPASSKIEMYQCETSYPPLANLESLGSKLSNVIEQAASGDIGKT